MALLPNVTLPLSPPRDTFDLEAMRRRLDSLQNISTPNRPQGSERGTPYTGQTTRSSPDGCLPPLMDEELEESDAVGVPTALFDAFALQGLQHQMGQQQHQQQPPPQQQQQQPPPQQSQALQQLPLNCVPMVPKAKPQQNQAEPVQQFVQFVVPQQGQQNSQQQPQQQQQQQQNPQQQQQQQQQVQLLQQLEGHQPLSQQQNGQNPQQQQQNGQQNANSQQHSLQRLTPLPRESHTCTSPQAGALMYAPPRGANLRVSWRNRLWSNSTLLQARFGSALSNFFRANYSDRSPSSEPLLHNNYPSGSRVYFGGKVNISHCVCHHLVQIFEAFALTADGRPDPLGLQALWIAPSQSSGKVYGYAKFVDPRMATDAVGCLRMQSRPKTPLPGAPPPGTPPSDTAIHVLEQVGHCLVPSVPPHETSAGARGWSAKALGILRVLHTLSVRYRAAGNSAYIGGMPHHVVINAFMEVEAAAHAAFGQGIITAAMVDSLLFNAPCPYIAGTAPPREPVWLDEISMANEQRPGHAPRVTQHQHPLQHRLDGISIVLPGGGQQQQELAQKPAIGAGPPQQMDVAARQPSPSQQPQQQPTQQQQQQHQQQQPHIHVHGFQTGSLQGTTPYQLPLNISITR